MTRSSTDTAIAQRLIDRADAHNRMSVGNGAQYLGFYSGSDAQLMRDAAEALRGGAATPWTLVEEWRSNAVKHIAASGEDDCEAGTEEWLLHRESQRIYTSCADQLASALSGGAAQTRTPHPDGPLSKD